MSRRRRDVAAAGLAALVAVAVVAELTAPSPRVPRPDRVAVTAAEAVCPEAALSTASGSVARTRLSMVAVDGLVDGVEGAATTGTIRLGTLTRSEQLLAPAARRRAVSTLAPEAVPYVGRGDGSRAPGLALDALTTSGRTADHGLAGVTCGAPVNEAWFAGAGTAVGRDAVVHLVNPEPTPATVDVEVHARTGLVHAPGSTGVEVAPRSTVRLSLSQVAPGAGDVVLHVVVTSGRVAVGVRETEVRGLQARGVDWLPQSEEPARRVVVPGLLAGSGARRITILAPGTGTETVQVGVVGKEGAFTPTGGGPVDIDRGRVTTIEIGDALTDDDGAVVVESPVPVVVGARWQTSSDIAEIAFSAGAPALTGPAVVPGLTDAGGLVSTLALTATGDAAKVRLQLLVRGRPSGEPRELEIPAGTTVRTPAWSGATGRYAVLVTPLPGSGPVHGALVRTGKVEGFTSLTLSTLRPARAVVAVPAAQQDLGVLLPD